MELINVIVAAALAFGLGAIWYGVFAEPWMNAVGMERDENGKPKGGQNPMMFAATFVMQLFVAGMMRHIFALSGIDTIAKGVVSGIGIGLFFIVPWIAINNMYGMRPLKLTVIDGGYAVAACTIMGIVLTLF